MRTRRIAAWVVLGWAAHAAAAGGWGRAPECYLGAVWTAPGWQYGRVVCFPEPNGAAPALRDTRRAPPEPPAFDPLEAWQDMDAAVLADVALGEDPGALEAVMWTVVNRARTSGRLVPQVVRVGRAYGTVRNGRFLRSWSRVPGRRWARYYPGAWAAAVRAARRVLSGDVPDPTAGATHFHRAGTWRPPWAPEPRQWTTVGAHHFYAERVVS